MPKIYYSSNFGSLDEVKALKEKYLDDGILDKDYVYIKGTRKGQHDESFGFVFLTSTYDRYKNHIPDWMHDLLKKGRRIMFSDGYTMGIVKGESKGAYLTPNTHKRSRKTENEQTTITKEMLYQRVIQHFQEINRQTYVEPQPDPIHNALNIARNHVM